MMTTRRSFLKGTLAGAVALVAGVKLPEITEPVPEPAEAAVIETAQPVAEHLAEKQAPQTRICGTELDNGILINGQHFNGNFSISYHRDKLDILTWGDSFTKFMAGGFSATASLGLLVDHGVELPWVGDECDLIFPCHVRCKGLVNQIGFRPMPDGHWVDMELTCHDVVQEYAV